MQGLGKTDATILPVKSLEMLSRAEINRLQDRSKSGIYNTFRQCALAVLNSGRDTEHIEDLLARYSDFDIVIAKTQSGIKLELINAPAHAFIKGEIIQGIAEMLFAVLRDLLYSRFELGCSELPHTATSVSLNITDLIFYILRNAGVLKPNHPPDLVVCWGGHAITQEEYDYAKSLGYALGLQKLQICTGCGSGAMRAPMEGAAIAHNKQRVYSGRYIGISEPAIIAAEAPNPIVNHLVVMPDIEKRLEAFVRLAHSIIIFPGGVGTLEELLYLLAILLDPANVSLPHHILLTGPESSADYFNQIDTFIRQTLGPSAQQKYQIILADPTLVAQIAKEQIHAMTEYLVKNEDAFYFNWSIHIAEHLQQPFYPSHQELSKINLTKAQPIHQRAADLRKIFSAIVAGNVKAQGREMVKQQGPFVIKGDKVLLDAMDKILQMMVQQNRMKLLGTEYQPCYKIDNQPLQS